MNEYREALRLILTTPLSTSQLFRFSKLSINTIERYREIAHNQNPNRSKSIDSVDGNMTHPENHRTRRTGGLKKNQYRAQER